jgi:hypothetical protein
MTLPSVEGIKDFMQCYSYLRNSPLRKVETIVVAYLSHNNTQELIFEELFFDILLI